MAIVAVGLLSAQLGGRALWALPAAFLGSMLAGCLLGIFGEALPAVEYGIGLSVLLLGLAVATNRAGPLAVSISAAAVFGLLHGHVHGTEMPLVAVPALYAAGLAIMTLGLQCRRYSCREMGDSFLERHRRRAPGGALVAACGFLWLVAM